MNKSLLYRGLLILAVVAVMAFAAFPPKDKINLGLDLQGGIHLVLKVQAEDALRAETEKDMGALIAALNAGGAGVTGTRDSDTSFSVTSLAPEGSAQIDEFLSEEGIDTAWDYRRSGDGFQLSMDGAHITSLREGAVRQAVETIRNRVDAVGVAEPVIQAQMEEERIVVQLPGVDDPERVKELIKATAFLEFRYVDYPSPTESIPSSEAEILAHYGGSLPSTVEILPSYVRDENRRVVGTNFYAVERAQVITGRDLKRAIAGSGRFGEPVVNFSLSPGAANRFGDSTAANIGRGLAIVLDKAVVSAPRINDKISDRGVIEGTFTRQEVEDLVTTLKSGSLPAGIVFLFDNTVGPSLGQDSIDKGRRAFMIGGVLVILVMLLVYRLSGVNAIIALSLNVVLIFGVLGMLGATLTLPGIAGLILTVGMAVDANVLVFERIKEELRSGRTVRSAVDAGFGKALSSIIDANVTTLIAALFLFQFGSGPVRGFAVTLSVGVLASMFTALFVSRWLFDLGDRGRTRRTKLSI